MKSESVICVQKERKLLQVKRLDLDAAKTRLKKARMADARAAVSSFKKTCTHTHYPLDQHCCCVCCIQMCCGEWFVNRVVELC